MKLHTFLLLAGCFIFPSVGESALFIDTVTFPAETFAVDETSGNHVDFTYFHSLPDSLASGSATITGVTLEITHLDNANEGPTREIWAVLDAWDQWIGNLSASENVFSDLFSLNTNQILSDTNQVSFGLSEQTPYNREKVALLESQLTVEYSDSSEVVSAPEPSTLILLLTGFAGFWFWRQKK